MGAVADVVVAVVDFALVAIDGARQSIEVVVAARFDAWAGVRRFDDGADIAVAVVGAGRRLHFAGGCILIRGDRWAVQCINVGDGDTAVRRFAADAVVVAVVAPAPRSAAGIGLAVEALAPDGGAPESAGELAARAAAHDERLPAYAGVGAPRRIDDKGGCGPGVFLLRYGPWFAQVLARSVGVRFDALLIERVGSDREPVAQVVEQGQKRVTALFGARRAKF